MKSADTTSHESGAAPERSTESVLRAVCLRLGCTAATAVFARQESRSVWGRSEADLAFAREQLGIVGEELARRCSDSRKPIATNKLKHKSGGTIACKLVAVPLIARGGPAGALIVFNRPDEPSFDEFTVRRLGRFARLLARSATQDLDSLTGLLSWDGFKSRVQAWSQNATRESMVSMLYGDIDRLHLVNDLAGFTEGDRAIARCGGIIRHALVGADSFACRLSGDRFTVFLPHMNLAQARQLAETICREGVSGGSLANTGPDHPVSISWGAVSTSASELHLDHRIAEAEIACKLAKDRGRGRVEVYQDTDHSMIRRHDEIGLIGSVREALRDQRIVVFAQPHHPLINHALPVTYELLVRIIDSKGNLVEAADFMSAATRYQILPEIDRARMRARLRTTRPQHQGRRGIAARLHQSLRADTVGSGIPRMAAVGHGEIRHRRNQPLIRDHGGGGRRQPGPGAAVHPPPGHARRPVCAGRLRNRRELTGVFEEPRDQHHQTGWFVRA